MSRKKEKVGFTRWIGVLLIVFIGIFGVSYLVLGEPVNTAEDVAAVYAYDAASNPVNVTDVKADGNVLQFYLQGSAAILKLKLSDQWKDLKASFTRLNIDFSDTALNSSVDGAKAYLSDGVTEVYVGFMDLSEDKSFSLYVSQDDLKAFDDYANAYVVIKFYNANGTLMNALQPGLQKIQFYTSIKTETSSIVAFISSILIALAAAMKRLAHAITSTFSAFVAAITTNNAVIIMLSFFAVLIAMWYLTDVRKITLKPKRG